MTKAKIAKTAAPETAETAVSAPAVTKAPKKIRMLNELGTPQRAFPCGSVHIVGVHVSEETARVWITQGHAEAEDK